MENGEKKIITRRTRNNDLLKGSLGRVAECWCSVDSYKAEAAPIKLIIDLLSLEYGK